MLGSGELSKKLGPEKTGSTLFAAASIDVVSSFLGSLLILCSFCSLSSARGFLCASQRSAELAPRLGGLLPLSHLSHDDARPGFVLPPPLLMLPWLEDDEDVLLLPLLMGFLLMSQRAQESARPGFGYLGLEAVGGMMTMQGVVLLGGVGRRPGRSAAAALAVARSTDAIEIDSKVFLFLIRVRAAGDRSRRDVLDGERSMI
ncbi:hypothetical protein BRADI_4g38573v3 [Brachypodium distachyon]|uniref:Uncharacterized protein n=1 Tax=Brachypodium distachyon TaxID=15368 RepID=A0A2K2CT40_BRADI|nr:hypothetical protein BRADI_4g38573v3 [Brachypodium distachyon]